MNEYLFRGFRLDNGEKVEGDLVHCNSVNGECLGIKNTLYEVNSGYINSIPCIVNPKTVSQYTGFVDGKINKLFDNNIIKDYKSRIGYVTMLCGKYLIRYSEYLYVDLEKVMEEYFEIIGNTTENPELLEVE
jgi:hypothetical protein